jgi:uncharacterized membrane protein YgcG
MRKEIIPIFVLILLTSFVLAVPSAPQGFNGNIVVSSGDPNGKLLVGYVNGIATGQAIITKNKTTGKFEFDIVVADNLGNGGKVEFYIGNEKAAETFTFKAFDVTKTDLTFGAISQGQNFCGNHGCDSGECSFCAIDCNANSPICVNNGRCDTEIGETCSNAPGDCACSPGYNCVSGVCTSASGGSSGGGSSGGSSSGGGSSGGSSGIHTLLSTTENTDEVLPLVTPNSNENGTDNTENKTTENSFTSLINGAVTGFMGLVKSGNGIYVVIGGISIAVLGIAAVVGRKKKPVEVKTESSENKEKTDEKA